MNGRVVLTVTVALFFVLALTFFISGHRDIREDVRKAEKSVLDVLRAQGVIDGDILLREEQEWSQGKIRGKILKYVFKSDSLPAMRDLEGEIRNALRHIKSVHIDKVSYHGGPGLEGTAELIIAYKHMPVLSVTIKNVSPGWMESGGGEIRRAREDVIPPVENRPAVALVLDDFGYSKRNLEAVRGLGIPLTLAVLPNTFYTKDVCLFSEENGIEVILHMPMEPENSAVNLEKDTIGGSMAPETVEDIIARAYKSVPSAKGMSNHMGSKATKDERFMAVAFGELKKRDQFFLDSLTTEGSVCDRVAERSGVPCLKRDIFIDSESDKEYISRQMQKLERLASSGNDVVAIGHDRRATIEVLREVIPKLKENGIRFVTLSEMVALSRAKSESSNQ